MTDTLNNPKSNFVDECEMSRDLSDILLHHPLFSALPGRVITDLTHQFSTRKYSKGQYVFHQDDIANCLFVVVTGEVSIETLNMDGKVTKISQLNRGDIFGEFSLIDGRARSASAVVARSSYLATLNRAQFYELIETYPSFSKSLMEILVNRLRQSKQQIESILTMSLMQRTSQILLQLSKTSGPEIKITQTNHALRLDATREKVTSKLNELERLGAGKT